LSRTLILIVAGHLLIRPGRFGLERELPGGVCTHDICAPWQGTQWNKIEHRLFSFISHNWRARPLVSYQVIIDLISATTTKSGLKITCELDTNTYEKGIVVSDDEMAAIHIIRDQFHGEWNYTIRPFHPSDRAVNP
jgi:hypothetical protein